MKKYIVICLLILSLLPLCADPVLWDNETAIRQGVNIEWNRSAISTTDDCVVYSWSDTRDGDRDLWAQKVDADGNLKWGASGKRINGAAGNQEKNLVCAAENGGTIFAWIDFRAGGNGDVYAQKTDANGNLLWNNAGVPVCTVPNTKSDVTILSDNAGGAYLTWSDHRNYDVDIYGMHLLSDGTRASGWDIDGNAIVNQAYEQYSPSLSSDGAGGVVLIWIDIRDSYHAIYGQRLLPDGTQLWGSNGKMLVSNIGAEFFSNLCVKIAPTGGESFMIVWTDRVNDGGDIKAQRVSLNGNLLWNEPKPVYVGSGYQVKPQIINTSDSSVIILWNEDRSSSGYYDIHAQKISIDGSKQWAEEGVLVSGNLNNQINQWITADSEGGAWLTWEDGRNENHPYGDIYAQHLNSAGINQLAAGGAVVADLGRGQFLPAINKTTNGKYLLSWVDDRDHQTGIYVKSFAENGQIPAIETLLYQGINGDALNFQVLENGSQPVLVWTDTRNYYDGKQIYYQVLKTDGSVEFSFNGKPFTASSGFSQLYFDAAIHKNSGIISTVWNEYLVGGNKAYIQAAGVSGNSPWGSTPIALSSDPTDQNYLNISAVTENNTGFFYTGWSSFNNDYMNPVTKIYAQKVALDGSLLWGSAGKVIGDQPEEDRLMDQVGRYFIWENQNYPDLSLFVKLIDENGNSAPGWPDNGLKICTEMGSQSNAKGYLTPSGILVVWENWRNGVDSDIWCQLIGEDGQIKWAENGILLAGQSLDQRNLKIAVDSDYIYGSWCDSYYPASKAYLQKYNFAGSELFTPGGFTVTTAEGSQQNPAVTLYSDNIIVAWEDYRSGKGSDIYVNLLNKDGSPDWTSEVNVCSAGKNQQMVQLVKGEGSDMFVVWLDGRSSGESDIYGLYAQKINVQGVGIDNDAAKIEAFELLQNYPNPFNNSTMVRYLLKNTGDIKLSVYNAKGEFVETLFSGVQTAGSHSMTFNAGKLNSGVYFYKLESEGKSRISKMLLLK